MVTIKFLSSLAYDITKEPIELEINKLIKELNFHNKIIIIDPIFNIFELYSILDLHILNSF